MSIANEHKNKTKLAISITTKSQYFNGLGMLAASKKKIAKNKLKDV